MSGMDVLRERIARALWEHRYPDVATLFPGADFRRYITPWERIEEGWDD